PGSTHGIGLATARALAEMGATVLVHGRDGVRARAVARTLGRDTGNLNVRSVHADFAELAQVRRLAQELASGLPRLDVLINNAGVMGAPGARSADGYDLTFAVNHLAPFLLTHLLPGRLAMSSTERGARGSVYLASAPGLAGESGGYYRRCRRVAPSAEAESDADAERLWLESARLTGLAA